MKNWISLTALAMMIAATGCGNIAGIAGIAGSGVPKSEDRPIRDVTKIHFTSAGTLILKQSDKESLTVKGDDNVVPLMKSEVVDGKLTLGLADNTSVTTKTPMVYMVEVKSLTDLHLSGACEATLTELSGKTLTLNLTGACKATLKGKADSLQVNATGASSVQAEELVCKTATLKVTGASNATVHAEEKLEAEAAGASHVTYSGEPAVAQKTSGASSVKKR